MERIVRLLPGVLSALLISAALPPLNLSALTLVALVPWFLSIERRRGAGAAWSGYWLGAVLVAFQMAWTRELTLLWTGSASLSYLPWVICIFLGGFYFAALGWAYTRCAASGRMWLFPVLWAGVELIRSYMPLIAFPWFLMANPLVKYPAMVQTAAFGSVFLVSAGVVVANLAATNLILRRSARKHAVLVLAFVAVSLWRYSTPIQGNSKRLISGQLGVDLAFGDPNLRSFRITEAASDLVQEAATQKADLLVMPEGLFNDFGMSPPMPPFDLDPNLPTIFGGRRGTEPVFQSAFGYNGKWSTTDKTRLVVFGEYVPMRWLPFLDSFKLAGGDLTAGASPGVLNMNGMTVAPMICFEALFPDISHAQAQKGAQVIAVLSIDDWYIRTPAAEQLAISSRWRAIELGIPLVRAASLGMSELVDGRGRLIQRAPIGATQAISANVTIPQGPFENPFRLAIPIAFALAWIPFVLGEVRKRRGKRAPNPL